MFVRMTQTLGTPTGAMLFRHVYDVPDALGASWVRAGLAVISREPPEHIAELLARLDDGAGKPCLFLPFVGEFGHLIMSHVRLVHWHKASEKVVCCRPGEEVLFPSASHFITNWTDPIADVLRVGTHRNDPPAWPDLLRVAETLDCQPIQVGGLTLTQELHPINPEQRIEFRPKLRGLRADVVIGTRRRAFAPEKNWQHWQRVADALTAAGFTFAVIGAHDTSESLAGQSCHSGDYDTDAAIELLQNCRLYLGTDSGGAHLASTVGAPMLIWREPRNGMRDFVPRMQLVNPGRVEHLKPGWDDPALVIRRTLEILMDTQALDAPEPESPHYTAQHGEDRWMARNWARLGLPDVGTFVEVGAGDGKHLSNTYWLEKVKGWRGLLVEPDPRQRDALAANRPDATLDHVAAGAKYAAARFGLMECPEHSGLLRSQGESVTVAVETLSVILDLNGIDRVDVLSIDTEGSELDVWSGLDLTRWRPRLVIIEWNTVGLPSNRDAILARLTADGYRFAVELGGNLLFMDRVADVPLLGAAHPAMAGSGAT